MTGETLTYVFSNPSLPSPFPLPPPLPPFLIPRAPIKKTFRHMAAYSKEALCTALLRHTSELDNINHTDDVDNQLNIMTSVFTRCLDECAPIVTTEITKPFAPWINTEIRSAMNARNALQARLKRDRSNTELQNQYRCERNRVKTLIQNAERCYYKN